jgi:hypothetical protein
MDDQDNRDLGKISMTTTNFGSNMNNEAFQKLVRDRAGVKTSKEIAREAVEAEFKGRGGGGGKRRRPRDDYSSDEDDTDRSRRATDRKQQPRSVESQDDTKPSESQSSSQKYRDRALERRQGAAANEDVNGPHQLPPPEPRIVSTAEALFDDVVAAVESGDRRKLVQLRKSQTADTTFSRPAIASVDEALAYIANPSLRAATAQRPSGSGNTELGQAMLTYLRETYLPPPPPSSLSTPVSAAGRNIQRSQYTFTMTAHPSHVARSWEYPREDAALSLDDNNGWVPKATPCIDERLLAEMQQRLDRKNMMPTTKHLRAESVPEPSSLPIPSVNGDNDEDDDDDDDIFGNVGDYDGKSAIQAMEKETNAAAEPKTARPSIFAAASSSPHDVSMAQSTKRNVDAVSLDTARPEQGLTSLSSYANNYDDDGIGMDFGGRDYDDEDEGSDKKSSSKTKKSKSRKHRRERSPS